jgi:DNA-binding FrmR family transcriptional regulator
LNRIAGQIEGIKKMVDEGRYCPEILSQLRAVRSAVKGIETEILRRHLSSCVDERHAKRRQGQSPQVYRGSHQPVFKI